MRKEKNIFTSPARPWQLRWWREDSERWRWGGTIVIVLMLMGAFAYQNPDIWKRPPLPQADEGGGAQIAENAAPVDISSGVPAIPEPPEQAIPEALPSALVPQGLDAEDLEPQGMESLEAAAPVDEIVAVSAPPASWQQPAFGEWTRGYGYALDPTYGDYRFHHGRDMELDADAPIFAAAAGRVLLSATDPVWGGVVVVEHGGGWQTIYKCLRPEVVPGTELAPGEQIGVALSTTPAEKAQPTHLHFEIFRDGEGQNPEQWL